MPAHSDRVSAVSRVESAAKACEQAAVLLDVAVEQLRALIKKHPEQVSIAWRNGSTIPAGVAVGYLEAISEQSMFNHRALSLLADSENLEAMVAHVGSGFAALTGITRPARSGDRRPA